MTGAARGTKPSTPKRRRTGKQRKLAECVFKKGFVTDQVDPLVDEMWKASIGGKTPFGDLRNQWRRLHCRTLNPYGDSENCPYDEKDCARAFYAAVREVARAADRVGKLDRPVGYFTKVARTYAARRADEAVGRRAQVAMMRRTFVPPSHEATPDQAKTTTQPRHDPRGVAGAQRPGEGARPPGGAALDGGAGHAAPAPDRPGAVPGSGHGPVAVGDLFGSLELGPRQGRPEDRAEGSR